MKGCLKTMPAFVVLTYTTVGLASLGFAQHLIPITTGWLVAGSFAVGVTITAIYWHQSWRSWGWFWLVPVLAFLLGSLAMAMAGWELRKR